MSKFGKVLKSVLVSYIITGLLLLLLSFAAYKFEIQESIIDVGITIIYLFSTFVGGLVAGKAVGKRRFFWGMLVGAVYIGILYGISYGLYREFEFNGMNNMIPLLMSMGAGMFGGMMS